MHRRSLLLASLCNFAFFGVYAQNTFPASGNVGIGTTSPQQRLHVEGTSNQAIFVSTTAPGNVSGSGMIGYIKALPTDSGNRLGYFLLGSRGGAQNNYNQAGMAGYAGGGWSGTSHPAYLSFETTPLGSTGRLERLRIGANGNVGIGTGSPLTLLHVNGLGSFGNKATELNAIRTLNLVDTGAVLRILRVHKTNSPAVELISRWSPDSSNASYWDVYTDPKAASFRIRDRLVTSGPGVDRLTILHTTGNVGIGTSGPAASALLELASTTKGMLLPRMTLNQRNLISSPARGLLIFQTDNTPGFYYYDSGWKSVALSATAANATLSNLSASTAINTSLLPQDDGVFNLGSGDYRWKDGYFSGHVDGSDAFFENHLTVGYGGDSGANIEIGGADVAINAAPGVPYGTGILAVSSNEGGRDASYVKIAAPYIGVDANGNEQGGTGVRGYSFDHDVETPEGDLAEALGTLASGSSIGVEGYTNNSTGWGGYFQGRVYASGGYFEASDQNLKENIRDFSGAMSIIKALKPKQYDYKHDGNYKQMMLPKGNRFGLLAQDVEKVLPEAVGQSKFKRTILPRPNLNAVFGKKGAVAQAATASNHNIQTEIVDFKTVSYTQIIPILIKGLQEQDEQIADLKKKADKIAALEARLEKLEALLRANQTAVSVSGAYLEQSSPNPSRGTTLIRYGVPEGSGPARLVLTNAKGQVIKEISLGRIGSGQVDLNTASLPSGVYSYALWVDGKQADSRQLVVAK